MAERLSVGENIKKNRPLSHSPFLWNAYLYQLQQQAPIPKRVVCTREIVKKPQHYGREFHGKISREEANILVQGEDGCYLVRESQRCPGQYTLSLRFGGLTKNFKLYFDGKHYVGEKKFDTIQDLVGDGLITLYLEVHAGDYIALMSTQSRYEDSPYKTLNSYRNKIRKSKYKVRNQDRPTSKEFCNTNLVHVYDRPPSQDISLDDPVLDNDIDVQQFEKPHMFKTHNFKSLPWCDFCGNFMWGLIAQGVKCEDCGFCAHRRCSEKVPSECMPDLKYIKRVFGVDLTTLVKAHKTLRPIVVDMCIQEIESRGLESEGLYRVSGFIDDIEAIRLAFDKDGENADICLKACEDIHVITNVLKLFFRLLPIPLITFNAYPFFISATKKTSLDENIEALKEALKKLPPAHYQTIKYLMAHLNRVSKKHKQNLMTSHNLSTVFCPTLLRCPEVGVTTEQLTSWQIESVILELLISYQKNIFEQ